MSDTYKIGSNNAKISLQVILSSNATCSTKVIQKTSAGVKTALVKSAVINNGSIDNTAIGVSSVLSGSEIIIQTIADCGALPSGIIATIQADPSNIKTYLTINYIFIGGQDGSVNFTYEIADTMNSTDGKQTIITKHVQIIS